MKTVAKHTEPKIQSLLDVEKVFPDEKTCIEYMIQKRWNGKPRCPHCDSEKVYRYSDNKRFKCPACAKQFTIKIGTIFEDSPLSLQKWFFAIFLLTAHKKGISSCQLARDIHVTQKSAWFMTQRIRELMKTNSFEKKLNGIVEADETYVGGKKHSGKRGRGSENKTPVFGMVARQGDVRTMPVERVNGETLKGLIRKNVDLNAVVMTDEWTAYNNLSNEFKHEVINHSSKEYVRGNIHTNNIENFWSLLKRGIVGIYHHVDPKHLHRYTDEFQYRYNSRKITDADRFTQILSQCEGRLTYATLINK
jgi:transposase-like protein